MKRIRVSMFGLVCLLFYAAGVGAVIDCSKPKTKIDWLLCSNEKAALEEERMAFAFREAMNRTSNREALMQEQREWNTSTRDLCNDVSCLVKAYRERAGELETY